MSPQWLRYPANDFEVSHAAATAEGFLGFEGDDGVAAFEGARRVGVADALRLSMMAFASGTGHDCNEPHPYSS